MVMKNETQCRPVSPAKTLAAVFSRCSLPALATALVLPTCGWGQTKPPPAQYDPEFVRQLLQRLESVEQELKELKGARNKAAPSGMLPAQGASPASAPAEP